MMSYDVVGRAAARTPSRPGKKTLFEVFCHWKMLYFLRISKKNENPTRTPANSCGVSCGSLAGFLWVSCGFLVALMRVSCGPLAAAAQKSHKNMLRTKI